METVSQDRQMSLSHSRCNNLDARLISVALHYLPVTTRMPLKFGSESLTSVTCARAQVTLVDRMGRTATGWGETPLSVQWAWPSLIPYGERHDAMCQFCIRIAQEWLHADFCGHPLELGQDFQASRLGAVMNDFNQ